jgi:bacteriocin biosynthesis cyclodehydratase domain-containing protein
MPEPALVELTGMRRPRMRDDVPVIWRTATSVQLGDRVVLHNVSRQAIAWMTSLDGLRPLDAVLADLDASLADPAEAPRLLRALAAAGALEDAACLPDAIRWAAPQQRPGSLARFGATVASCGDPARAIAMTDARDQCRIDVRGTGPAADAVRTALGASGMTLDSQRPPHVTVLADAAHPDVPELVHLPSGPHLHVGILGDRASVGPLVVPGRTSCLRCAHLHRRDADPAWPVVSVQWTQAVRAMRHPPMDPLLVGLAAHYAALLLRRWIDHPDEPDRWADLCQSLSLPDAIATTRSRPPHPLCGCRWLAA